ncbi:type IV secretion system protein VirB10 [Vibrio vulnificus]
MSDDLGAIPSISNNPKKDRGAINVKGKEKKKRDIGLFLIIAFTIMVPVVVFIYLMSSGENEEQVFAPINIETEAVVEKGGSDSSASLKSFINNVKRENEMKNLPPAKVEEVKTSKVEEIEEVVPVDHGQVNSQIQQTNEPPKKRHRYDEITMARKLTSVMSPEIETESNSGGIGGGGSSILDAATAGMGFDTTFDSPKYENGTATVISGSKRNFLLSHGTNVSCGLETEIISTHAGLVTCIVSKDVYSSNGRTLLVEKGSKVFGNQSVAMEQGQARVFITWADIKTTQGVKININSLGTGSLGAAGVDAWVDDHFAARFGGAIMLSFLDDAFATIANKASNEDIETGSSMSNATDMASIALENSINIAPTGYVPIGHRLNILIARDVDLSTVYEYRKIRR